MINAVASLNAYSQWMDNSASNVAGATSASSQTRKSTISSDNGSPTLQTTVEQKPARLEKEMTDQVMIPKAAEASATAIRTEDEMMGTLLDLLA